MRAGFVGLLIVTFAQLGLSDQKWQQKDPGTWTTADCIHIVQDSAWAKQANAYFGTTDQDARNFPVPLPTPQSAGLGGPSQTQATTTGTDGHWDGGVGRMPTGGTPTLPVMVRWDSAEPIRRALFTSHSDESRDTAASLNQPEKDYVIAVVGLIPGSGKPSKQTEDDTLAIPNEPHPAPEHAPIRVDIPRARQALMSTSRLGAKGKAAVAPDDVQINELTGEAVFFFPKTHPITDADKEAEFSTKYGSMEVTQRFRLKDMVFKGKLAL
jgi:hypothetical protein